MEQYARFTYEELLSFDIEILLCEMVCCTDGMLVTPCNEIEIFQCLATTAAV